MHYRKILAALVCNICICCAAFSQTLFTVGTKAVDKAEFLKAFNKNPDTSGNRPEKIKQYLDLYVNFKLKLQAAYDEKLNTDPNLKFEADNFRDQLVDNIINEQANINGLIHEAFERSMKDISLSQVFIEVAPGTDTADTWNKINQAYNELKSGANFGDVSAKYSTDEQTKNGKGNIGYITAFSLPYAIENIVYSLKPGTYSAVYKSGIGYHIFQSASERPAAGKRKIQQILFAVPASFTADEKNKIATLADSVYKQIQNGASFDKMLELYAAPVGTYNPEHTLEVGVGQYTTEFEKEVFTLQNKGDISKLFETAYGFNIIKFVDVMPVSSDENDVINRAHLQELVQNDNRLSAAKDALLNKWMQQTKFTTATFNQKNLWAFTDSAVADKKAPLIKDITGSTVLFSFAKQKITAADWVHYVQAAEESGDPILKKPYPDVMAAFQKQSCSKYYRSHIEEFYPSVKEQMHEFNEANLLFAVMDKHVWNKASQDTTGLKKYYEAHKSSYMWAPGVSALVVSSPNKSLLDSVALMLRGDASSWRSIVAKYDEEDVVADSSRFENGQLPIRSELPMTNGFISPAQQNEAGDTYTFIYIFDMYANTEQRNFEDARGMVINDYQQVLEEKWISELKKKYPVVINQAVLKTL